MEDEDLLDEEEDLEAEEEEEEEWDGREFVSDDSESEFGGLSDLEDMEQAQVKTIHVCYASLVAEIFILGFRGRRRIGI